MQKTKLGPSTIMFPYPTVLVGAMVERKTKIQEDSSLPINRKCTLMDVSRSTMYYKPVVPVPDTKELEIKRRIDKLHETSFHGFKKPS